MLCVSYKMENENASSGFGKGFNKAKPYLAMVSLQFGYSGMYIITMVSFKHGMSHWVLSVYRHIVATLIMAPFAFFLERSFLSSSNLSSQPFSSVFNSFSIHLIASSTCSFQRVFSRLRLLKNKHTFYVVCFLISLILISTNIPKFYERKNKSMQKVFTFIIPLPHNYHVQKVMFLPFYAFCSYFNFFL